MSNHVSLTRDEAALSVEDMLIDDMFGRLHRRIDEEIRPAVDKLLRTNAGRKHLAKARRAARPINQTPLSELARWLHTTKRGYVIGAYDEKLKRDPAPLRGAPWRYLEPAFVHVEARLIRLAGAPNNHRTRSRSVWLGRWSLWIQREMQRRILKVFP
jgi:hypothetical protein